MNFFFFLFVAIRRAFCLLYHPARVQIHQAVGFRTERQREKGLMGTLNRQATSPTWCHCTLVYVARTRTEQASLSHLPPPAHLEPRLPLYPTWEVVSHWLLSLWLRITVRQIPSHVYEYNIVPMRFRKSLAAVAINRYPPFLARNTQLGLPNQTSYS